jgi:Ca-activated chloride channel family protein
MTELRGHRNEIHGQIRDLAPEGATNIYDGLEVGYRHALENYDSGRQNRMILLSDGQPTEGETSPARIMDLSRTYNSEGVGLTAVGLGTDFNYSLMRGLAEQGDGNFYFVENADAVEEVFTEELSYFTLPVAFDVQLTMRPGSDYQLVRAYGSRFWETTDEGLGQIEVPSVFLAHRVSHDDVGEGGTRRGGGSALLVEVMPIDNPDRPAGAVQVADLELSFREPGTNRIVEQRIEASYAEGADVLLAKGFFDNSIVEKSFVMLNVYVGLVMATDMFHFERDLDGAVGLLRRLVAAVRDYEDSANDGEGDIDMQLDIELLEDTIAVMLQNGAEDQGEEIPEDPWPAD